ncbi:MAG: type 2 isopentenyl-diphosphate Delta-isomerase [Bacteriovorax sp.]|nr:type 2 isopentenyl-diphosphate Delta-isomerase [Bacteriovorax sp.]
MPEKKQESRKLDHIELALKAQTNKMEVDQRFYYEPLFAAHPSEDSDISLNFLGKRILAPLWVSSMTGGVGPAKHINQNLARVCREFGLGMGLGSCRVLLDSDTYFPDFNLRPIIGSDLPLYANLGIAQIEQLLAGNNHHQITDLIQRLDADGLIVHINPLQEWFQLEGDRLKYSPIQTLTKLCSLINTKLIVKEVGQGLGPKSLKALLDLPIVAIELAAFGGTNFSKLEQIRGNTTESNAAFSKVGHTAFEMVQFLNSLIKTNSNYNQKQIIISGGVDNILDGFYLRENLNFPSVIGQAKNFLNHAENYEELRLFTMGQINGLKMANAFLIAKEERSL